MCLVKKFNKKIKKWIVCDNIFDSKREDLEAERRDKKFLVFLSVPKL